MISTLEHRRTMGEQKRKKHYHTEHESSGLRFIFPDDGTGLLKLPNAESLPSFQETEFKDKVLSFDNSFDRKKISEFYFKIEKHEELYSLGKSFTTDLEKRDNSFGFYSLSGSTNEETIIALSSFFSNQLEINPLIVSCTSHLVKYSQILGELKVKEMKTEKS